MLDIDAFHLPGPATAAQRVLIAEHDGVRAFAPDLARSDIDAVCEHLINATLQLRGMPAGRIIAAIDTAARRLVDPGQPARERVLRSLHAITGYSPAMAAHVLDRMSRDWLEPSLTRLLDAELGGGDALTGFARVAGGVHVRAVAPALGFHVFSGNVPGVNVTSIVRALLVRSAVFGKSAAAEPVLAPVFVQLLHQADPEVGDCAAVTWWAGGDEAREAAVMRRVGLVVHYGGATAIESLRARAAPHIRFVEHGPRISFALIDADGIADRQDATAADLARAVALFDQQGCVSPQLAYVIGSTDQVRDFGARVAAALEALSTELPRGRIHPGEAAAIRDVRTRAEFAAIQGGDADLWAGDGLGYTVIRTADAGFEGTCLNRTLLLKRADSIDDVIQAATPFGDFLQTVGVAGLPADPLARAAEALAGIGVTRVAPIPAMPWPPVTWHHDGRGPLTELVRWVDLEV